MERIVHGLAGLAQGLGMRATARVCEVAPTTVLPWLVAAGLTDHVWTLQEGIRSPVPGRRS